MVTLNIPCIVVEQPIGKFYLGKLGASALLNYVSILRRGITEDEQQNVQRKLSPRRQREIADYVSDPDATFPTSIIISVYDEAISRVDEAGNSLTFRFQDKFGEVLDGQHRLEGLRLALDEGARGIETFELPVVFMLNLSPDDKAYIFSVINSKQTKVPSSLIFDLFGLQLSRSPSKTCHEIAQTLNAKEESPFYRGIKMLGNKEFESEYLTQGAFSKYLLKLISKKPDDDARLEKLKKPLEPDPSLPLRELYIRKEDAIIAKIVENYFAAVAQVFPNEWTLQPKRFLLRKTAGYSALMTVLQEIWPTAIAPKNEATRGVFLPVVHHLKEQLAGRAITSEEFGSSEQGAKALAEAMLGRTS